MPCECGVRALWTARLTGGWTLGRRYDPVGQRVFVGTYDVTIMILDISTRTPKLLQSLAGHKGSIRCVSYDARKKYLFSGSFDATVVIWDIDVPGREKFVKVRF